MKTIKKLGLSLLFPLLLLSGDKLYESNALREAELKAEKSIKTENLEGIVNSDGFLDKFMDLIQEGDNFLKEKEDLFYENLDLYKSNPTEDIYLEKSKAILSSIRGEKTNFASTSVYFLLDSIQSSLPENYGLESVYRSLCQDNQKLNDRPSQIVSDLIKEVTNYNYNINFDSSQIDYNIFGLNTEEISSIVDQPEFQNQRDLYAIMNKAGVELAQNAEENNEKVFGFLNKKNSKIIDQANANLYLMSFIRNSNNLYQEEILKNAQLQYLEAYFNGNKDTYSQAWALTLSTLYNNDNNIKKAQESLYDATKFNDLNKEIIDDFDLMKEYNSFEKELNRLDKRYDQSIKKMNLALRKYD